MMDYLRVAALTIVTTCAILGAMGDLRPARAADGAISAIIVWMLLEGLAWLARRRTRTP